MVSLLCMKISAFGILTVVNCILLLWLFITQNGFTALTLLLFLSFGLLLWSVFAIIKGKKAFYLGSKIKGSVLIGAGVLMLLLCAFFIYHMVTSSPGIYG